MSDEDATRRLADDAYSAALHAADEDGDDEERTFAFGEDEVGGCLCPSAAAGFPPKGGRTRSDYLAMASMYDHETMLLTRNTSGAGVVPESVAREAWLMAVHGADDPFTRDAGLRVAVELGWLSEREADEIAEKFEVEP